MKRPIEEILDICLEKMRQGVPINEVLRQYPDYADELKELLAMAKDIKEAPLPQTSDRGMVSCLVKVGEALQLQKERAHKIRLPRLFYFPSPAWARTLVFALMIIFIYWGTVNLSAHSLPGDLLYPVKLMTEKVKFFITVNPENRIELRLVYSEERMQELVKDLDKRGQLNTSLLKAMLDEATLALENVSVLPEEKRSIYYSRLEYLNTHQKDILENIKPKIPFPQEKELDNAIQMCGKRMQWMGRMKRGEVPHGKWGPCCGEK